MCKRLVRLLDELFQGRDLSVAEAMGYKNATMIEGVRKGTTFPDVERLQRLVDARLRGDVVPNLHWVIAGTGSELLSINSRGDVRRVALTTRRSVRRDSRRGS